MPPRPNTRQRAGRDRIGSMMTGQIEQFIQQPAAPNLYWALATLPRPLIDFRPALEEESNFLYLQFPELKDLDKKDLDPEAVAETPGEDGRGISTGSCPCAAHWSVPSAGSRSVGRGDARLSAGKAVSDRAWPSRRGSRGACPWPKSFSFTAWTAYQDLADDQFLRRCSCATPRVKMAGARSIKRRKPPRSREILPLCHRACCRQ